MRLAFTWMVVSILSCVVMSYAYAVPPAAEGCLSQADRQYLMQMVKQDPRLAVKDALAHGKRRFWGIMGYSIAVPTIDKAGCYVDRKYVQVVPGFSDEICGGSDNELYEKAESYIEQYNLAMKPYLASASYFECVGHKSK